MVNILLCCSTGMSSSILVKKMRSEAKKMNIDAAIGAGDMKEAKAYLSKVDILLIAPQMYMQAKRLRQIGKSCNTKVFIIDRSDFGRQDAHAILLKALNQIDSHDTEEEDMDTITKFIQEKITPMAAKLGANTYIQIIRDAMMASMALLIIGSIATLLANIPIQAIDNLLAPIDPLLNGISSCTTGLLGLFTAAAIGYFGAIELGGDRMSCVVTSTAAFAITQYTPENGIDISGFSSTGLFTALVVGLTTVMVLNWFAKKNIVIKMPDGVPPAVSNSFSSLIPAACIMIFWSVISIGFNLNFNVIMHAAMTPITAVLNTPIGYAVYHMLCGLVFWCGINSAVICDVAYPFIVANGAANEAAIAAGKAPIYAATYGTDTMIWAGGTGATIGLVILMAFCAKSKQLKTIGRMSLGPGLFNINEPVIFGTPICFNGLFLFPFVLLPGILAFITYILMDLHIIQMGVVSVVPWTLPPVICSFFMSGGAISTTIWGIMIVIISLLIYYPFFRIANKKALEEEKTAEAEN